MELCVRDRITENPTADDIARAIDAAAGDEEWFISLESDAGALLEAFVEADGTFQVMSVVQGQEYTAVSPIDAAKLKSLFVKFLNGDASWRAECRWKAGQPEGSPSKPVPARDTSAPPAWAIAALVGTFAAVALIFYLAQWRQFRSYLPFGDSDYFYIGLIFLPMVALVLVAVAVKLIEVRRAAAWLPAAGRIVKSGIEARHHRFAGDETTVTNIPAVEYEFSAAGRTWRGSRIGIGEDTGGANTEATLARYPAGAAVTVYYDPADPSNCVLEREVPKGVGKGCAAIVAIGVVAAAGIYYLTTNATRLLETYLPNANAPVTVFTACFGLFVLLFFFAYRKHSMQAANWPFVRGTIVSSGTETIEKREGGRTRTSYAPAVEFAYQVHGIDYRSRQIKLGVVVSGSRGYAERVAARYQQGSPVEVHYDPDNPSNAALENPTGYSWLMLAVAVACFGIALFASGVFN